MGVKYMNVVVNRLRYDDRVMSCFVDKRDMIVARSFEGARRNIRRKYALSEINTRWDGNVGQESNI